MNEDISKILAGQEALALSQLMQVDLNDALTARYWQGYEEAVQAIKRQIEAEWAVTTGQITQL